MDSVIGVMISARWRGMVAISILLLTILTACAHSPVPVVEKEIEEIIIEEVEVPDPIVEGEPEIQEPSINESKPKLVSSREIYTTPRYPKLPITYFITNEDDGGHYGTPNCGKYETNKIMRGFDTITNVTDGVVDFEKVNNAADSNIDVTCTFIEDCYVYESEVVGNTVYFRESICAYIGGLAQITKVEKNVIKKSKDRIGRPGWILRDRRWGDVRIFCGQLRSCRYRDP